ncbi:MAG TPA: PAS domain S-box protein [Candidatus Binataceae bacterium]|nr:PAS domain S-box protein [Candidatus Binataceae bacterium]
MDKPNLPPDVAAHLAAIIASSDDIIVSKTLEGIITSWNPAAERILGYTAEEAIGKHITLIIPRDRWPEEDDVLARIGRGERVDHFETIRQTKDGRLLNISLTVSPVRDSNGRIIGASKVARDITEKKSAERELDRLLTSEKQARRDAEEANRLKDEFLAVVSHELRSPLNAITGWASLLQTGRLSGEQAQRAVETIQRNAQLQNQMIADLLDVSRIVSGRMRLDIRSFQLIDVIEAALEVVRPAAEGRGIRLQTFLDPGAGPVAGDPDRLQQVFTNLLSNSIKFTPRGGRVQVQLHRVNSHVEILVTDTGEGIDAQVLPFIFERFRQGGTGSTREYGGLGLGLTIAKHLTELHGGIISARSEGRGKGTQFTVQLPLMAAVQSSDGEDREHPTAQQELRGNVPSLAGLRVLIVDDEADARDVVSMILSSAGAEVDAVDSAARAIEAIERRPPDILVSDIGMPQEDGFSLLRKLRALPPEKGGTIPAIALTAFARTQDRLNVLSAGYQMHVPKPIEQLELLTVIASLTKRLKS